MSTQKSKKVFGSLKMKILAGFLFILGILPLFFSSARAATDILNTCTGTYQMINGPAVPSGFDTAIVRKQESPTLTITKYVKNLRTGIEEDTTVIAISGDTIEFRIVWANTGEAKADTIVLTDYIDTSIFTYVNGSVNDTEVNVDSPTTATYYSSPPRIIYTGIGVNGTDGTSAANGVVRFRVRVN